MKYYCSTKTIHKSEKHSSAKHQNILRNGMSGEKTSLTVRLDKNLVAEFKRVCDEREYSQSFVIRELIKKYISENKQRDLFK